MKVMKEKEFIEIIKSVTGSGYIGDDCAYLKDLGIVMTQDNLVENVHFRREWITPYQLGRKAVMVNISDVCASGAKPLYASIALSLPPDIDTEFIKEFYKGACSGCVEIVGGDITGADKIFISVTAIGSAKGRRISSRSGARVGQKVVVSGEHGSSGAGLQLLRHPELDSGSDHRENSVMARFRVKPGMTWVKAHLEPTAQCEFSERIASHINEDYAMMDTSDGLMDALVQIAQASGIRLSVDFDKIPYDKGLEEFNQYKDLILYGGEDYQLVAAVPDEFAHIGTVIGEVKSGNTPGVEINGEFLTAKQVGEKIYDHFRKN